MLRIIISRYLFERNNSPLPLMLASPLTCAVNPWSVHYKCGMKQNWRHITNMHQNEYKNKQECIPVGCVPPTAVAVSPATHHAPPITHTSRHAHPLPCMPPAMHTPPTRVDRQTPVKTLPSQTSLAGGKGSFTLSDGNNKVDFL